MKTYGDLKHLDAAEGWRDRAAWLISAEPHVTVKLKRWFPRSHPGRQGALMLVDTPDAAADLQWLLERWPLEMDEDTRQRLVARADEHRRTRTVVEQILTGGRSLSSDMFLEPALPPRGPWQMVPADIVLSTGRTFLGDELGLGKTYEALMVFRDPRARPGLLVAPPHLQRQWVRETGRFFPTLRTHVVRSTKVYDPASVRGAHGLDPDLLIISYTKLASWADFIVAAMKDGRLKTVIFEEAHELRRRESQKYGAAARIAEVAEFKLQVSGTPVFNYGGDIHTIMRLLDEDALGSRDEFVREWGRELGRGKVGVMDPRALGFHLRDQALLVRRTYADVGLEKSPPDRIMHEVDTDQDTFDNLVDEAAQVAQMIVDRAGTREEQFKARGDIDWRVRRATGIAKAPYVAAFVNMLLEQVEKVVLFGWHRDVYDVWLDKLAAHNPVLYTGTESPRQKDLSVARFIGGDRLDAFNAEDVRAGRIKFHHEVHTESRVFIMSLRSGSGLDGLQEAAHVAVIGELDWSPAMHDQGIGRLDRTGQAEHVLAYFLVSDEGSDPPMMEVLGIKREQGELIRDPTLPMLEQGNDTSDRAMLLAQAVLAKRRGRKAA